MPSKLDVPTRVLLVLMLLAFGFAVGSDGEKTRTVTAPAKPVLPKGDLQESRPAGDGIIAPGESDLRDQTPPGVPAAGKPAEQGKDPNYRPRLQPLGGAQNYSCRQDFSGHVYSSRNGAKVRELHLHYTVSPNVDGWGDILGVQNYFKQSRVGSATYIVDFEGHCLQMVPRSEKPWTQGAFNPISISWEIIATGRETRQQWLDSPLIKDGLLAAMVRDEAHRAGLPLRFVDPVGCDSPLGYTDHLHLECGNFHTDVAPNFPWDVFNRQLASTPKPVTKHARQLCQQLNRLRHLGHPTPERSKIKRALAKKGYACRFGPPGRVTRR